MMQWKGVQGFAEEANYSEFTDPTRKIGVTRGNARTILAREEASQATGSRIIYRSTLLGFDEEYDWEQWVSPRNIGEILKWTFGTSVPTDLGGGSWQHDITIATELPSFTLSVDRGIAVNPTFQLAGCKINNLTFENVARGVLTSTTEGVGRFHRNTDALSVSAADRAGFGDNPFIFQQLAVAKGIGGAAQSNDLHVMRVSLSFLNNLVVDKNTSDGSYYIHELPEGELQVTGAFDKQFEDLAEFNAMVGDDRLDLTFTWTGAIIAGTDRYQLSIDLPNAAITSEPLPEIAGGNEQQVLTVEFVGRYYTSDDKVVSAQLINNIASY